MRTDLRHLEYLNSMAMWSGSGDYSRDAIRAVMKGLGNPQDRVKIIHIGGTNGKGSTAAGVASILGAAGYRVGLTISPHLVRVNERIVVDGLPIEDAQLNLYVGKVRNVIERLGTELSFFELIIAAAYLMFYEEGLDYGVVEVGLGGSRDATNIISAPEVAAIVSVDLDHQHILGDTRKEIAADKAGIIKRERPIVVGRLKGEALQEICRVTKEENAQMHQIGKDFDFELNEDGSFNFWAKDGFRLNNLKGGLEGDHQLHNLSISLKIGRLLGVADDALRAAIEQVYWPARLEEIRYNGLNLLFDCAHNEAGVESLVCYLKQKNLKRLYIGLGMLACKEWQAMVDMLIPYAEKFLVLTPDTDRALGSEELCAYIKSKGAKAINFDKAYLELLKSYSELIEVKNVNSDKPLLVVGSIYMLGAFRGALKLAQRPLWNYNGKNYE